MGQHLVLVRSVVGALLEIDVERAIPGPAAPCRVLRAGELPIDIAHRLSERMRRIICCSPTLFAALQQVCRWAQLEDTNLGLWLEFHGENLRICSRLAGTAGLLHLEHSQWLQNVFPVHIVRQFAGPDWMPAAMAFESRYIPGAEPRNFWSSTRFLAAQGASWIEVPVALLSLPNLGNEQPSSLPEEEADVPVSEIVNMLKLMLPSYLDGDIPTVIEIAEMANVSVRSFQRKLSSMGMTYSGVINVVRYENAARLLRDTDAKVIDVALSLGYSDPAHFTRAFRRVAGVTPRQYRSTWKMRDMDIAAGLRFMANDHTLY